MNGTFAAPDRSPRLSSMRYAATTIETAPIAGAMIVRQMCWPSFATVAKYLMMPTETMPCTTRMPLTPSSGPQVPSLVRAASVVPS